MPGLMVIIGALERNVISKEDTLHQQWAGLEALKTKWIRIQEFVWKTVCAMRVYRLLLFLLVS